MAEPVSPTQSQQAGFSSLAAWLKGHFTTDPAGPMQYWKTVFLFFYLVIAGFVLIYFVFGLWAAEPQAAQWKPVEVPKYNDANKPAAGPPKIDLIDPKRITIGVGLASIRVFGYNFIRESRVRFDDVDRPTHYVDEHQLVVPLSHAHFNVPGAIVITVANGERSANVTPSNATTLEVETPGSIYGEWRVFGCAIQLLRESRLMLLVLFTGAFGACMSGLPSLANYLGDRKLVESWFTFYLVRPLVGGGIAFIFYLVIRGGFLAGTDVDTVAVNPFGLAAVAALVGMFSDSAILKLKEVSSTLFKIDDPRSDPLDNTRPNELYPPAIRVSTGPKLPDARVAAAYTHTLTARGGTPPYRWEKITPLPPGLDLEEATGVLTGTPTASAPTARYRFRVTDATGATAIADLELTVL
jgi:Putative Ig domain